MFYQQTAVTANSNQYKLLVYQQDQWCISDDLDLITLMFGCFSRILLLCRLLIPNTAASSLQRKTFKNIMVKPCKAKF